MSEISAWVRHPGQTPIRRSGLTDTDIARAQRALPTLGGGWAVDRHEDYDRSVSLVIAATDDREDSPAFALHIEAGQIQAGMVMRDRYHVLGRHDRIEDAIRAIATFLRGERPLAAA